MNNEKKIAFLQKELDDLMEKMATSKGELRQLKRQIEEYGITPGIDVDKFLLQKEEEIKKEEEILNKLIKQVEEKINEFQTD